MPMSAPAISAWSAVPSWYRAATTPAGTPSVTAIRVA